VQVAGHLAKYCRGGPKLETIVVSPTTRGCNNIHILVKVYRSSSLNYTFLKSCSEDHTWSDSEWGVREREKEKV